MYDSNVAWTWLVRTFESLLFLARPDLSSLFQFWVLCLFGAFCLILAYFTLPETYAPVLLVQKAKRLRKETGDPWFAPREFSPSRHCSRLPFR